MKVYVLSRPSLDKGELKRFLDDQGVSWESTSTVDGDVLCEVAGRVCYMSFANPRPGGNRAYLEHIKECGHGSVLEHAVWTFLVTGVSRSLTHELVRHRAGFSYSQLSQRYVFEKDGEFVEPDIIAGDEELHSVWLACVEKAHGGYVRLANLLEEKLANKDVSAKWLWRYHTVTDLRKVALQAARSVLPNCTETKIVFSANARALRHFIELRGSRDADWEMRKLANELLNIMQREAPNIFSDYIRVMLPDGTFEVDTEHKKV